MNKKSIIASVLIVLIIPIVLFSVKKINTKEVENNKVVFNAYIQYKNVSDNSVSYEKWNSTTGWPDTTKYDLNKSVCKGLDGKEIDIVVTWDKKENKIIVKSLSSMNCDLYFNII